MQKSVVLLSTALISAFWSRCKSLYRYLLKKYKIESQLVMLVDGVNFIHLYIARELIES